LELFHSDQIGTEALNSCFDAFSSREPASTSLENALIDNNDVWVAAAPRSAATMPRPDIWPPRLYEARR
jgi:hypothetical protein